MEKQSAIAEVVKVLLLEKEEHKLKIQQIDESVKQLQTICPHTFTDYGHDSHYSYEICTTCGFKRSY